MIPSTLVRLKNIASINDDQLDENISPDFVFEYVDVGSVGRGFLVDEPEKIRFGEAPSRARRLVRVGDTIVSTVRTYLRAILPITPDLSDVVVSTGFAVVRPRSTIDPRFLSWALQADPFVEEVVARSVGVSYPAIAPSAMADIKLAVPVARQDQRLIADFLDGETQRIDALVDAKRRMMALLEEKRVARSNRAVRRATEGLRSRKLKHLVEPSGIRPGPFGSALRITDMEGDFRPVYSQRTVIARSTEGSRAVTASKALELGAFNATPGDLLVSSRGTIGRAFLLPADAEPGIVHPSVIRVRLKRHLIMPDLLEAVFNRTDLIQKQLRFQSNETTIPVVYAGTLSNVVVSLPERWEAQSQLLTELNAISDGSDAVGSLLDHQLGLLAEYRQALITKAVTGQLDEATLKGKKPADEVVSV